MSRCFIYSDQLTYFFKQEASRAHPTISNSTEVEPEPENLWVGLELDVRVDTWARLNPSLWIMISLMLLNFYWKTQQISILIIYPLLTHDLKDETTVPELVGVKEELTSYHLQKSRWVVFGAL